MSICLYLHFTVGQKKGTLSPLLFNFAVEYVIWINQGK